jgi:uncharacterized protein (TIGR02246 family)
MRFKIVRIVVIATFLSACQSMSLPGSVKTDVEAATRTWATAFNSCDIDSLVKLYDADAVFWGTSSPTIRKSPAEIREYFERGCSTNLHIQVAIGEQNIRIFGDTAINSGAYMFTALIGGQPRPIPARFSFAYRKKDGQWLIVDHHSSALPAPPMPASAPAR